MHPTRRGYAVFVIVAVSVVLLFTVGQSGLGIVAVAGTVVLLASAVQAGWYVPPTVDRRGPTPGHEGDSSTVRLHLPAPDPYPATVRDRASRGLAGHEIETTVGGDPIEYELGYEARGVHRLGPVEVVAQDSLGLFRRRFTVGEERRVPVYPRVRSLEGPGIEAPSLVSVLGMGTDREFDFLREYRPGDSPQDIDWRASAKRDELIVAEYEDRGETAALVAGAAPRGHSDTLAEAVASVALALFDRNVAVGLALADVTVSPDDGDGQRQRLLEALARTQGGPRPNVEATVDVTVTPSDRVVFDGGAGTVTTTWPPAGEPPGSSTASSSHSWRRTPATRGTQRPADSATRSDGGDVG